MLSLRSYKIGTRLILTTIGALGLMIVFVGIALYSLNTIGEKVDHIINNNVRKTSLAVDMRMRNLLIARHMRTALIYTNVDKQLGEKAKVDADFAKYLEAETQIVDTTTSPRGKEIVARILVTARPSNHRLLSCSKTSNWVIELKSKKYFSTISAPGCRNGLMQLANMSNCSVKTMTGMWPRSVQSSPVCRPRCCC